MSSSPSDIWWVLVLRPYSGRWSEDAQGDVFRFKFEVPEPSYGLDEVGNFKTLCSCKVAYVEFRQDTPLTEAWQPKR